MKVSLTQGCLTRADEVATLTHPKQAWETAGLGAILILAAVLRFIKLSAQGYVNHYYTAAVVSMLQSWHNFFFVAAEPGGAVSVDKPPVGLWLQTISAHFFGVNGFAVLLPQILAGILSVVLVYYLVQRAFGKAAGLLAALALAITPVVVAVDRNNTIDSTLVLVLLLAAWAFIRATETNRLRYLLLGAALVGAGFNVKMMEAFLPLPAFYALYFLGAPEGLWRKVGRLALASCVLLVVSLSWALAVDLTPADQRPYVGSSEDNSELTLILGYNGLNRLLGMSRGGGGGGSRPAAANGAPANAGNQVGASQAGAQASHRPSQPPSGSGTGGARNGRTPPGKNPPTGEPQGGGRGTMGTGQAGALRLFTAPLSKEARGRLPFGLASLVLLLLSARLRWPLVPAHQAAVLWGGWLVTGGVFFSIAGYFHEYYLTMLAAPLAALVGIGAALLWRLYAQHTRLAAVLLLAAATGSLAFQTLTAAAFAARSTWLPLLAAAGMLLAIGATLLAAAHRPGRLTYRRAYRLAQIGFTGCVAAMLVIPGAWAGLTALNIKENQSLPSAYSGGSSRGGASSGELSVNQALLDYLQPRTLDTLYLMAVPSSMQGADYVIATGRPVLYMGGFKGQDTVVDTGQLDQMVQQGQLRYIYGNAGGRGFDNLDEMAAWLNATCTIVDGFETATRNAGTPDGTAMEDQAASGSGIPQSRPGVMQTITLYECGL